MTTIRQKLACYMGFITQAIAANFAPLLFLKFHSDYHISLGNIALISTFFFFTQLLVDLFCAKFVDHIGYRVCIVASEIFSSLGLLGLAFLPDFLPDPFIGIICSVIVYAIGSGLIEVLCSPIIEACPFENKEATMSLLHSFYCWGAVGTILISSLFFLIFGIDNWKWLAVIWAIIPAVNTYNFMTCPIEPLVDNGSGMGIKNLFSKPFFWVAICLMICSGASELCNGSMGFCLCRICTGIVKNTGRFSRSMYVCSNNGNQPYNFWKIWRTVRFNEVYEWFRHIMCYLLSSCCLVIQPDYRTYRLYCMWIFSWNHVAWNNQYFLKNFSNRWNGYVLSSCHGRRFRWQHWTWNCWSYHPECWKIIFGLAWDSDLFFQ